MPFGLCYLPSSFQVMMNSILHNLLDEGVVVHLDDILIHNEIEQEHVALIQTMLNKLCAANLYLSIKKSFFYFQEVEFLYYHISNQGVSMSVDKVSTVKGWPT